MALAMARILVRCIAAASGIDLATRNNTEP